MAIFLGVHKFPTDITDAQAAEGFEKYKAAASAKGITPLSAFYNIEKGIAYCQTEAENADQVKDAHAQADVPVEDVIEIKTLS